VEVMTDSIRDGFLASASQFADALPDGVVVVDAAGTIVSVNRRLLELTGYVEDGLVGESVDRLVPAARRSGHASERARFVAQPSVRSMEAGLDLRCERADGSSFPADIALSPVPHEGGLYVVATVRDATDRRTQEGARREAEERFRLLVESALGTAIFVLDVGGRVRTWNPGAQRLKGYASDEIIGQPVSIFYTPDDIASGKPERLLAEAAAAGRVEDFGWRVRKDGSRFQATVSITASVDELGQLTGFTKITRDITAALDAREDVERLHLFEQREQLGRDLHDGVIQAIFAVGMGLQALLSRISDPLIAERLQQSVAALDDSITELRSFIFGLGNQLTQERIRHELERLVSDVRSRSAVEVTSVIDADAVAALGSRSNDVLLVAREALSNVARHSQAANCVLSLQLTEGHLVELVVEDDGRGYDPTSPSIGLGLNNARARAHDMGADYTVDSSSRGTRVALRLPVTL
jgi:PAS domain S-box-containing protein